MDNPQLPAGTTIGHAHLQVSDLEQSVEFYTKVLGLKVTGRIEGAVFLSFSGYHHDLALNNWNSKNQPIAPKETPGLFHVAIRLPNRKEMARVTQRLIDNEIPVRFEDHVISEAVYFTDSEENGLELTWDRPRGKWPTISDGVYDFGQSVDTNLEELLRELD